MQARDWLSSYWSGYNSPSQLSRIRNTGVPQNFLKEVSLCRAGPPLVQSVHSSRISLSPNSISASAAMLPRSIRLPSATWNCILLRPSFLRKCGRL